VADRFVAEKDVMEPSPGLLANARRGATPSSLATVPVVVATTSELAPLRARLTAGTGTRSRDSRHNLVRAGTATRRSVHGDTAPRPAPGRGAAPDRGRRRGASQARCLRAGAPGISERSS